MLENEENKQIADSNNKELSESDTLAVHQITDEVDTAESEDELLSLTKQQLAEKLIELFSLEDALLQSEKINTVKRIYDSRVAEDHERRLKIFTADGDKAEDFEPSVDPLDAKVDKLFKEFTKKKSSLRKQKEKELQENLSTKLLIVDELRELLKTEENFGKAYAKFQALQTKWRSTGNVPKLESVQLHQNFNFLTDKFYEFIKISNELRELDRKKKLETKTELCSKIEALAEEPSIKKAMEALTQIQEDWSEASRGSRDQNEALWVRFKTGVQVILERKNSHIAEIKKQLQANLEAKTLLCERVEALIDFDYTTHNQCRDIAERSEGIWAEWQKIGYVPKSDKDNCWKRFKKARHAVQQKIDSYYAKQRGLYSDNLEKKIALCLKAEALQESADFSVTANELKRLQAEWKNIGPAGRKDSEVVWNRFRKACDHFFERKNNQALEKENALKANVQVKESILAKMEQLEPLAELQQNMDVLKIIQEEWGAAGEVPYRETERLNNAFGKASENFLKKLKGSTPAEQKQFNRLRYEQLLKYPQGQEQIKKERYALNDKIKKLEQESNQLENNLGFFGKSKKANPVLEEYQKKLEEVKTELAGLRDELKNIPSVS